MYEDESQVEIIITYESENFKMKIHDEIMRSHLRRLFSHDSHMISFFQDESQLSQVLNDEEDVMITKQKVDENFHHFYHHFLLGFFSHLMNLHFVIASKAEQRKFKSCFVLERLLSSRKIVYNACACYQNYLNI